MLHLVAALEKGYICLLTKGKCSSECLWERGICFFYGAGRPIKLHEFRGASFNHDMVILASTRGYTPFLELGLENHFKIENFFPISSPDDARYRPDVKHLLSYKKLLKKSYGAHLLRFLKRHFEDPLWNWVIEVGRIYYPTGCFV